MKTKNLVIGALLAVITAFFQVMPVLFSEVFLFLTIFSAAPIYIVSRINPKAGALSYLVAGMLVMFISTHEGLFFLCTNGIIGVSLGACSYYTNRKTIIFIISSIALTITLSIMNYGIGIPIFGSKMTGGMIIQLGILFLLSLVCNIIYYWFSDFIFKILKKTNTII